MSRYHREAPLWCMDSSNPIDSTFVTGEKELLLKFGNEPSFSFWEKRKFTSEIMKGSRLGVLLILEEKGAVRFDEFVDFCGVKRLETYQRCRIESGYRRALYAAMVTQTDQPFGEREVHDGRDGFFEKYRVVTPHGGVLDKRHFMG